MADLEQYALDIQQLVVSRAEMDGEEQFMESAYVQIALEQLAEAGELDDASVCLHRGIGVQGRAVQVSGYSVSDDGESLDLVVAIHTNEVPPRTVPKSDGQEAIKRLASFLEQSTKGYFKSIEEATPAFDLAQLIQSDWRLFSRVRLILVTDGIYRHDPPPSKTLDGLRVVYDIWDAERFYRSWSSGREREQIEIDFDAILGHPVPCLGLDNEEGGYSTFLAIFPGPLIVDLYGRYGPRLLERNVRSFLQVKGAVNQGIRDTIKNEPSMFLAYNNGLSCTASSVEIERTDSGSAGLRAVRDLQIVNGGQTTASIYHAAVKGKADVSGIGVQVKLTILKDPDRMDEVVPLISKYANSQNKVQTADLMANDKFHRRVEELSRTIWAPARDGTHKMTRWFYERARGQYRDDIARERTPAQKKAFEATNPKDQMFTKTDLAKFVLTYEKQPHTVSRGAQYAFSAFTVAMAAHIQKEGALDQGYFERLVAKAILFREAERIARQGKFPGYRANIVTYSIAKLVDMLGDRVNLPRIWREQGISPELEAALVKVEQSCYDYIVEKANGGNVTQFCKREDCWKGFRELYISLPDASLRGLSKKVECDEAEPTTNGSVTVTATGDVLAAIEVGSMGWMRLANYATEHRLFSPKQLELITSVSLTIGEGRHPSKKSAEIVLALLASAKASGYVSDEASCPG